MFIARISRQSGEKVVKDEIRMDDLGDLLTSLAEIYDNTILEIHIIRGEK